MSASPNSTRLEFKRRSSEWLKASRRATGLGQKNAADEAKVSIKTVARWENGDFEISRPSFVQVARLYLQTLGEPDDVDAKISTLWLSFFATNDAASAPNEPFRSPPLPVEAVPEQASAPGFFQRGARWYLEMDRLFDSIQPSGEPPSAENGAPAQHNGQSWPELYEDQKDWLILSTREREIVLPHVLCAQSTRTKPLQLELIKEDTPFTLAPELRARNRAMHGRFPNIRENAQVMRLMGLKGNQQKLAATVQPTTYFDFRDSNLAVDFRFQSVGDTLREQLDFKGKKRLHTLEGSPLANLIGVNVLLIAQPGVLILPIRSGAVAYRARQLTPSASGTMEWYNSDFLYEANRELALLRSHLRGHPQFLGLARELSRGGLPETFFIAHTDLDVAQIEKIAADAPERAEFSTIATYDAFGGLAFDVTSKQERAEFERIFSTLISRLQKRASTPLFAQLAMWRTWMLN